MNLITLALAVAFLSSLTGYSQQLITGSLNGSHSRDYRQVFCQERSMADQSFLTFMICNFSRSRQSFDSASSSSSSSEEQTTTIDINSANLKQSHTIEITADSGVAIVGYIALDGRILKTFTGNKTSLNISPFLSKGKRTVFIAGNYSPANSSVAVELKGPGTSVSQSTGGSGKIRQTLIINVQ
ncbi:hypothetical protein ACE1CI_16185 [Aerosakkonemataceae cyanobacterium BLCC-F50]|uniref:Uncharacterized protein n=1 Tax=Floridaenema flaviceps BLCC-F50 TaxID=3153642 RepID=A0ABV4XRY1_9CYAN